MTKDPIKLNLKTRQDDYGNLYQHLNIRLLENYIQPDTLKNVNLPDLNSNMGIVIEGIAPNWLYSYIVRQCSAFAWIGCYYPQLQAAIVVKTNIPKVEIGQVIQITLNPEEILNGVTREDKDIQMANLQSSPTKQPKPPKILDGDINLKVNNSLQYQLLVIDAVDIAPQTLNTLSLPNELDLNREIVLYGSAPAWLYCYLVERCQESSWIACYNMRNCVAVVVNSDTQCFEVGDSIKLIEKIPCPAVIIGGPPDSGKSVLTYSLEQALNHNGYNNRVHTLRAHWDGHGDWYIYMPQRNKADLFSIASGGAPEDKKAFFQEQAELINNLRSTTDLALVDFGGYPQESDLVLVRRCTHYIIISNSADELDKWHDFFGKQGHLKPLAVIHSIWEDKLKVISAEPYLQIEAGKWEAGITDTVPDVLLDEVVKLFMT